MHGFGRRWVVLALALTVGLPASVRAESHHEETIIRIGALLDQQQGVLSTSPLFTRAVELAER